MPDEIYLATQEVGDDKILDACTTPAQRALKEAAIRTSHAGSSAAIGDERGGRGGLDPVRYGDWEVRGLASDF